VSAAVNRLRPRTAAPYRVATLALTALALLGTAACSGRKQDQYRTVTAYEFASCDSAPTTDPTEREALRRFRDHAGAHWFRDDGESFYAAMHERTGKDSGLRQYRGDPYWYIHVLKLEREDEVAHVAWKALVYLHAREVRTRINGGDWSGWQRVKTRNFGASNAGPTAEGMGRWACLLGAEIAWAEVRRIRTDDGLEWDVKPLGAGPYPADEIHRMEPRPTPEQIANEASVPAGAP
jgi:hypothetical protein